MTKIDYSKLLGFATSRARRAANRQRSEQNFVLARSAFRSSP
jgi:hypothetical protein